VSDRFCDYPQEIILQFTSPVDIKQINILSHEKKISTKIEIFSFNPNSSNNAEFPYYKSLVYNPLGFLKLSENSRSNFKARENRKDYDEIKCIYIKINVQKNKCNKYNIFNQVGLINIELFGAPLHLSNINKNELFLHETLRNQDVEDDHMDELCLEKFRLLKNNLEVVLKKEDYDEAKRIKKNCEIVRNIGRKIYHLDFQKKVFINNEDYDNAKILKFEIERLKSNVRNIEKNIINIHPEKGFGSNNPNNAILLEKSQIETFYNFSNANQDKDNNDHHDRNFNQTYRSVYDTKDNNEIYKPFDEKIIPTLKKHNNQSSFGDNSNNNNGDINNADHYEDEDKRVDELVVDINILSNFEIITTDEFTLEQLKILLFSKNIPLKEESLDILENSLEKVLSDKSKIEVIINLINRVIDTEIHPQLLIKTFEIILNLLTFSSQHKLEINSLNIVKIKTLIGESNIKLRNKAIDVITKIFTLQLENFDYLSLLNELVNIIDNNNIKIIAVKNMTARLVILNTIIDNYENITSNNMIVKDDFPLNAFINFVVNNVKSVKLEIRNLAKPLLLKLYLKFGIDSLTDSLNLLDEKELLKLKVEIPEVEELVKRKKLKREKDNPVNIVRVNKKKDVNNSNNATNNSNINYEDDLDRGDISGNDEKLPNINKKNFSKKDLIDKSKNVKSTNSKKCKFCDMTDRRFLIEAELDKHCATECKWLTDCFKCKKTIEIPSYNTHLLAECEFSADFKLCKKCREPIDKTVMDKHVKDNKCIPGKNLNSANRCLVCHKDIPPQEKGWKTHLIVNGCESNIRNTEKI